MIRINLLEETRTQAKPSAGGGLALPQFEVAENVGIIGMAAVLLMACAVVLVLWLSNKTKIAGLDSEIDKAKAEVKRLEYVLKQNEELQAMKKELNHRIEVITDLKRNQDKPVRMMLELSKEIEDSDNVWFQDLNFSKDKITVKGQALSKFNYSKFLKNLEDSEFFVDVKMGILEEKPVRGGQTLVTFRMQATFAAHGANPPEASVGSPTKPSAPPRRSSRR